MGSLGGRPRKFGSQRHPNGSVVRQVWNAGKRYAASLFDTDEARAKRDPREGSVAGRLELLGTTDGGITRFEKLAGDRFAEVLTSWRRRCCLSPNPNPPATNLQGGTGRTSDAQREISDAEQDRITAARLRYESMRKRIASEGMDKPPIEVRRRGQKTWDLLEAVFIFNQAIDVAGVEHMRKYGLKPLILHFGLTSDEDAG